MKPFAVAAGSIVGAHHRRAWQNNQDAVYVVRTDTRISACVADGCGSSPHSEVGAKLTAMVAAQSAPIFLPGSCDLVCEDILDALSRVDDVENTVRDYCLATVLGVLVTPTQTYIYGCGDGTFLLNDERVQLASKDNSPDYLAYNLIRGALVKDPGEMAITIHRQIPTADVRRIAVGTDGAGHLDLTAFMRPAYAQNPTLVEKRLRGMALHEASIEDDATVVAIWREGE